MSELRLLQTHLTWLGRHLRLRDSLRLAAQTLWSAVLLAALIQLAARWWPFADRHLWTALPLLIWLMAMGLYSLLRPLSLWQVARRLDADLRLKDRLATALELHGWKTGSLEDWKTGRLEDWKTGRLEDWKIGRLEDWKTGRLEDWKAGRLEDWKIGRLEDWKTGRLEDWKIGRLEDWKT